MLMVATDRLSAFDVVMNEPIPEKGRVLTGLTDYWVNEVAPDVPSALVSCDPRVIDRTVLGFFDRPELHGRTMMVRRATMLNLECIVRGRLAGQAYDEYVANGTVHHMSAPAGMRLTDPFPEPIFTPSTKAESGHDLNIDLDSAAEIVGERGAGRGPSNLLVAVRPGPRETGARRTHPRGHQVRTRLRRRTALCV